MGVKVIKVKSCGESLYNLIAVNNDGKELVIATISDPFTETPAIVGVPLQLVQNLLNAVDALDGRADIEYRVGVDLAKAADAVRVALGYSSVIES